VCFNFLVVVFQNPFAGSIAVIYRSTDRMKNLNLFLKGVSRYAGTNGNNKRPSAQTAGKLPFSKK
jgi:hypothetical protein